MSGVELSKFPSTRKIIQMKARNERFAEITVETKKEPFFSF